MTALTLTRRIAARRPRIVLVAVPSLGTTSGLWTECLDALTGLGDDVEVLLLDLPGHPVGAPRHPHAVDVVSLARDASVLVDAETLPVVAVGISMGGAVAVELAGLRPDRVAAVVTINSGPTLGSDAGWDAIVSAVVDAGTAAPDPARTRDGWFTPGYSSGRGRERTRQLLEELASVDPDSYIACCEALRRYDGTATVAALTVPGLAIGSRSDRAIPAAGARALAASNPLLRYAELDGAHLAIVEEPVRTAALVRGVIDAALADGPVADPPTSPTPPVGLVARTPSRPRTDIP